MAAGIGYIDEHPFGRGMLEIEVPLLRIRSAALTIHGYDRFAKLCRQSEAAACCKSETGGKWIAQGVERIHAIEGGDPRGAAEKTSAGNGIAVISVAADRPHE